MEPEKPRPGGLPIQIRPAVAAVLILGGLLAASTFFFEPPVEVRYGLVGAIAVLYFATKVRHWL